MYCQGKPSSRSFFLAVLFSLLCYSPSPSHPFSGSPSVSSQRPYSSPSLDSVSFFLQIQPGFLSKEQRYPSAISNRRSIDYWFRWDLVIFFPVYPVFSAVRSGQSCHFSCVYLTQERQEREGANNWPSFRRDLILRWRSPLARELEPLMPAIGSCHPCFLRFPFLDISFSLDVSQPLLIASLRSTL